jgi:cold shock CspA family protein
MSETQGDTQTDLARLTGIVKWFNNKTGYGFITVCEGEHKDKDIFVHYSSIKVDNQQYRFLTQGEYVDFALVKSDSDKYEFLAKNVSGVKGGPILCETRRLNFNGKRPVQKKDETEKPIDDGFVQVKPKSSRGRPPHKA